MSQRDLNGNPASAVVPAAAVAADGSVRGAIARAAQASGVDFSHLLAQARLESGLDPQARATTSSAAGLYQFTKGTWGTMLARHGAAIGVAGAGVAGAGAAGMALRYDPNAAAMMAAELAGDNATALTNELGRAPTTGELSLAHFLGAAGATRFLGALATDPDQSAAALLPKAAAANHAVFFDVGGAPRSLGAVMTLIQTRMDAALQDIGGARSSPGASELSATQTASWPIDQQFTLTQAAGPAATGVDATSMADTLRDAFSLAADGSGTAPDFVRSAYGRLQALGL